MIVTRFRSPKNCIQTSMVCDPNSRRRTLVIKNTFQKLNDRMVDERTNPAEAGTVFTE